MVEVSMVIAHLDRKNDSLTTFSFSMPIISRSLILTAKVTAGLIKIKTVSELCLLISKKSQRRYPQNATGKLSFGNSDLLLRTNFLRFIIT